MIKDVFEGNPVISVKRKNVQAVIENCLERKIEFTVKPGNGNEEWLIEFLITNVKKAVLLGMFLRENRLELNDISYKSTKATEKQAAETPAAMNGTTSKKQEIKEVTLDDFAPSLSFGEETM